MILASASRRETIIFLILMAWLLSGCMVGPNYVKPKVATPVKFKEAPKGWKIAHPADDFDRGRWWKIFHDPQLNALEEKLNISNQTIAQSYAQFQQALALVTEARAAYFPTVAAAVNIQRQKPATLFVSNNSSAATSTAGSSASGSQSTFNSTGAKSNLGAFNTESLMINASWEPDIWGSVRRNVASFVDNAQAYAAALQLARLSAQASLAQYYFELRGVDSDQKLLNDTVAAYKKTLAITINQYNSGTAAQADIVQARTQLENAQAQAISVGVTRAQYEHAIAVLIGVPASSFALRFDPLNTHPPKIPLAVPSELLERRPDIAQAERQVAQANEQIGVAIAALFPALTLSGSTSVLGTGSIGNWLSFPATGWTIGAQLADTIFDGGLRSATISAAEANFRAMVANYRQTVLAAFQDVEDNLASLRILKKEEIALIKAAKDAKLATKLVLNQYKSGTVPFSSVLQAEITQFAAEKSAIDVVSMEMTSAAGLIKALGGGWDACQLNKVPCEKMTFS